MRRSLVIGDEAASRAALTRLLTHRGYGVRTAVEGSEGLGVWPGSPDVLLRCAGREGGAL
jgi:CheY-like chemotaxis protein